MNWHDGESNPKILQHSAAFFPAFGLLDYGAALKIERKTSHLNIAFDRYASIGTVMCGNKFPGPGLWLCRAERLRRVAVGCSYFRTILKLKRFYSFGWSGVKMSKKELPNLSSNIFSNQKYARIRETLNLIWAK